MANSFCILYMKHRQCRVVTSCHVIKLFVKCMLVWLKILTYIIVMHFLLQVLDVTDFCNTNGRPQMFPEIIFFLIWCNSPQWARASSFFRFLDHTQRRTTVGRTPLDKWSPPCRDLYLTTHNIHIRHPCSRWDSNPQSQQASGRRPTP